MKTLAISILILFCLVPMPSDARNASRQTIDVEGVKRSFLIYSPQGLNSRATSPLVLVMHGGGGTARGLYRETRKSFQTLADEHGFFIVYPNAVRRMWDFGAGKVSSELKKRVNDRLFFERLLDHLTQTLPVDTQRIFATGISRGGQASYYLACQFPNRIRAIAPITMPMPTFMVSDCKAGPDIGLALLNGTKDPIVPYTGGTIVVRGRERDSVLSTQKTLSLWRERNGCARTPTATLRIDKVDDGTSVRRTDWGDCRGAPVRLYRINGAGHTWPSGNQYLPKRVVGLVSSDIDGAVEAWNFFSGF